MIKSQPSKNNFAKLQMSHIYYRKQISSSIQKSARAAVAARLPMKMRDHSRFSEEVEYRSKQI